MHTFYMFLLLTLTTTTTATTTTTTYRRILLQPFFPETNPTLPPNQPPSEPPSPPPQTTLPSQEPPLNIPFLSTTPPPSSLPFFNSFPSPPPPPSSSTASFPANISALNLPTTPSSKHTISSKLIPISITLAITTIIIITIFIFVKTKKRNNTSSKELQASFSDEKGPPASYKRVPKLNRPSQTSSEFLYLGTLVNSHGGGVGEKVGGGEVFEKVGSPELRPLPPLNGGGGKSVVESGGGGRVEVESGDDDEFYSPNGGRRAVSIPATTNYQSRRSTRSGSSSSYSSSSSGSPARSISLSISPPISLSPRTSRMKSPDLIAIKTAPPPSRPAPPPPPMPSHPSIIPSPDVGLSKDSLESSPTLSTSSSDQTFTPVRIPPLPLLPTKQPESTPIMPEIQLNPPVLIKPTRPGFVGNYQPENQENLEIKEETWRPKLEPLHWNKIRASSDHEMAWDHLKSSSFKLNEEMIETLFNVKPQNATKSNEKSTSRNPLFASTFSHDDQVLDPKKSQNISIALRAFNVTIDEVCDALLEGNVDTLCTELLESLMKMAPTKEEERKLKEHKDDSPFKLGPAEKFLKAILDVPFAFKRVGAMLYVSNFDSKAEYLKRSFQTLEAACEELRNNRMFLKLLEAVLKTGNRMSIGTNRGDAQAFKLDTLLKLIDIKGADGKTTLLHFVVQEIIRTEGAHHTNQTTKPAIGLQTISSLGSDLSNIKKAAAMDSEVLNGDVTRLLNGMTSIIDIVKLMESTKFSETMNKFIKMGQEEVIKIRVQESETFSKVKEITEYFHGNSANEEAHPFRIFMVVRDFLTVLDRVCKEVGARKVSLPVNSTYVIDGFNGRRQYSSSDDESSCSL